MAGKWCDFGGVIETHGDDDGEEFVGTNGSHIRGQGSPRVGEMGDRDHNGTLDAGHSNGLRPISDRFEKSISI